jgi:[FeFe] hydrogenase H-cluster maturation GTPase HydF
MGLNDTPSAARVHIGFFGRRNAGKSSVVNAVTDQEIAVVSDIKGTTTDPVYKAMELLPIGPVVIIDTPGFDDEGALGELRIKKTKQVLNKTDAAVLVVDASEGMKECDRELVELFKKKEIPYIIVYNKRDLVSETYDCSENEIYVSAAQKTGIFELKEKISRMVKTDDMTKRLLGDLINPGDFVVLVTPIDESAPKGRMILPQQQAIRDVLEADATAVVVKEFQLEKTLKELGKRPALVVTDSQVFNMVSKIVPRDIPLTSFSILMARFKGFLEQAVKGLRAVDKLKDGDTVLIAEGCTHHRQCNDIGTVKIPRWLYDYTGKNINIKTCSGTEFPEELSQYSLIIHCGGCMLNEREVRYRAKCAADAGVPFTNYGTFIAFTQGILERSIEMLPNIND